MKRNLIAAFLLCGAAAFAQGREQPRLVLKALDTDGDGKLSSAEIAAAPKNLLTLDRNGDGQLTPDELAPRPEAAGATADELVKQLMAFDTKGQGFLTPADLPARMQTLFTRGDTDHDGKLTPDEIRALARRQGMPSGGDQALQRSAVQFKNDPLLNALDTNHDGILSAQEIAAAPQSLLVLDVNHDGQITPDEMKVHQQTPEDRLEHFLDEWDTNKDGKISKAEAPDRMQQQFDAIDTNHDGFLDRAELLVYFKTMGNNGRPPNTDQPKESKEQKEQKEPK